MAVKRKRRGSRRRVLGKRRRRNRFRRYNTVGIVPDTKTVRLRYCQYLTLNPTTSDTAYHTFYTNGLYDPDRTGTGHQPLGFDQWTKFYDFYLVKGSKMKCTFISGGSGAQTGTAMCGITVTEEDSMTVIPESIMEQPKATWRLMTNSNAAQKTIVRKGFSPKKFWGLKDIADNKARLGSDYQATPPTNAFFHVWVQGIDAVTDPGPVDIIVCIDYVVQFSERRELVQS